MKKCLFTVTLRMLFALDLCASNENEVQAIISACEVRQVEIGKNRIKLCSATGHTKLEIAQKNMLLLQDNQKDLQKIAHCSYDKIRKLRKWTDLIAADNEELYKAMYAREVASWHNS